MSIVSLVDLMNDGIRSTLYSMKFRDHRVELSMTEALNANAW